jgi:hypothetical protein
MSYLGTPSLPSVVDIFSQTSAPFTVPGGILNPSATAVVPVVANATPQASPPSNAWLLVGAAMATYFFFGKRPR